MNTKEIVQNLIKQDSNVNNIAELERKLDISNGTINKWDKSQPNTKTLMKIADYFNVTTDFLLGRVVPEWATEQDFIDLEGLLERNVTMAYGGENLNEEEKETVKNVLIGIYWKKMAEKRKKNHKKEKYYGQH